MNIDLTYIIVVAAILWPIVRLLAQIAYKRFEHRLPANQQEILERYAAMAVKYVEQQGTNDIKGEDKKKVAMDMIKWIFLSARLPVPNIAILSAAIEAAVWLMKQETTPKS